MQPRVSSIFGSYDLFGKTFPGIVFFLLSISLLPMPSIDQLPQSNGILLAVLALFVIIFGFVAGQALHAVAVRIESIFLAVARVFYYSRILLAYLLSYIKRRILGQNVEDIESDIIKNDNNTNSELSRYYIAYVSFALFVVIGQIIYYIWLGQIGGALFLIGAFLFPIGRVKNWVIQTLYPHRELFENAMSNDEDSTKKFINKINDSFGINAEKNPELAYQLVMSYYERITAGRARQFQATFSFCRSIWSTLLLFSFIYIIISSSEISSLIPLIGPIVPVIEGYNPIVTLFIPKEHLLLVGSLMLFAVLLFMEGERQNKELFVEYIFIDFLTISDSELPEVNQSNTENTTPGIQ